MNLRQVIAQNVAASERDVTRFHDGFVSLTASERREMMNALVRLSEKARIEAVNTHTLEAAVACCAYCIAMDTMLEWFQEPPGGGE